MSPLDADKNFVTMMQKKAQTIALILKRKKCTVKLLDRVLRQCIFPMLSYSCQFAAISTADLNTISGPIRDAISFLIKGSSLNNKVTFAGEGLHYGLPFTDLADHINRAKAGMAARLNVSTEIHRLVLHSLLVRGQRRLSEIRSPTITTTICDSAKDAEPTRNPSCWALSLIEHIQEGQVDLFLPATMPSPRPQLPLHARDPTPLTQTLLTQVALPDTDQISAEEAQDFIDTYHISFVEELFPVNPLPPHRLSTHISSLQELFDPKYKPFIDRIIHTYAYSHLSLGHVVLRPHMCIDTHPTGQNTLVGPIMIEGLIDSHIYPDPSAAYRPWILNKHDKRGKQIICNKTIIEAPTVLDSLYLPPTSTRRLYSMANYDPITVYHDQYALQQRIVLPELLDVDLKSPAPSLLFDFPP
jgi:hypothetical protein